MGQFEFDPSRNHIGICATVGPCLTAQESAPRGLGTPRSLQSSLLTLQLERAKIPPLHLNSREKTLRQSRSAVSAASREGRRGRNGCCQSSDLGSRGWQPLRAGARNMDTIKCNDVIEDMLFQGNEIVAKAFKADVIILKAPLRPPVDDAVKDEIEELKQRKGSKSKLVVILETNGGFVETVERMVSVFRRHYRTVEFVVPNYAYSAGTILVLSGDEIHMDYYSVLGPIDPQVESGDGEYVPGIGYLAKFEELTKKINDPSSTPATTRAEVSYLISKFDPAKLFWIEQSIEHSKQLLREWLPKYKLKSWKKRKTSGSVVTEKNRQERADAIATCLGDAARWHSHGRGITIRDLESDEIKLVINNFSKREDLSGNIAHYHGLFTDYLQRRGYNAALHSPRILRRLA